MKCEHHIDDLVTISHDPFENGNTHQCIGRGAGGQCWKYVKMNTETGEITEDPYYQKNKEFEVTFSITGRASAIIKAESEEEAREKFKKYQIEEASEELIEWESDSIESIKEL